MTELPNTRLAMISSQAFSLVNFRGPLISDLVREGIKVYAIAPDYDHALREKVRELGAEPVDYSLSRAGMNPLRDGLDMLRLTMLLRRLKVDISFGYFIKPVIYGTLAAWLAGVPRRFAMIEGLGFVFTHTGGVLPWQRRFLRHAVSRLYGFALRRAERVLFLNDDDIDEFVTEGLVLQCKAVKLGGIGVDLSEWHFTAPVIEPVTFLLAARLLKEKGIAEYAEAARRVKACHPQARFILLGGLDPNPGALAREEIETWVAEGLLEWPGHVEVKPWLALTSVYVLPSYYREGVPRSTQEAMAMGRPVITTDAPGCRETVMEGENGYLIPVRDVAALAERMSHFIENPLLISAMGLTSRKLAEDRFDVRKINTRLLEVMGIGGRP